MSSEQESHNKLYTTGFSLTYVLLAMARKHALLGPHLTSKVNLLTLLYVDFILKYIKDLETRDQAGHVAPPSTSTKDLAVRKPAACLFPDVGAARLVQDADLELLSCRDLQGFRVESSTGMEVLGVPSSSILSKGSFFSGNHQKPRGNSRLLKRTMVKIEWG